MMMELFAMRETTRFALYIAVQEKQRMSKLRDFQIFFENAWLVWSVGMFVSELFLIKIGEIPLGLLPLVIFFFNIKCLFLCLLIVFHSSLGRAKK